MAENELENYRGQLPKGGKASKAAKEGDEQYRELAGASEDLLLPDIEMNSGPLLDRGELFMDMMTGYLINDTDGSKSDSSYTSMQRQATGYMKDAHLVEAADQDYALFAPCGNAATRALARTIKMESLLPEVSKGFPGNFEGAVDKHQGGLEAALKKSTPEVGQVSSSVHALESAASGVRAAAADCRALVAGEIIGKLHAELENRKDEQQAILEAEKSARKVIGVVTSLVSHIPGGSVAMELTTGIVDHFDGETPAPDRDLGENVVDGLRMVELEMDGLMTKISAYGMKAQLDRLLAIKERLHHATLDYNKAWTDVRDSVADQRTAYARLGTDADDAEYRKAKKGKSRKQAKKVKKDDDATQVMLYMSAVRETNLFMQNARTEGLNAVKALSAAIENIDGHTDYGFTSESLYTDGLTYGTKSESPPAVYKTLKKAIDLTYQWLKDSKGLSETLEALDEHAAEAMGTVDLAGDY